MNESRLADCWVGIFETTHGVIADPAASAATAKATLTHQLDLAVDRARELGYLETWVRESLFSVVAWVDETAMTTLWCGAVDWRRSPLQRHYFSTTRAGVEFFQRLQALPEDAGPVREVFGLALLAGFAGHYATRPDDELADFRRKCLQRIARDGQMRTLDASSRLFAPPSFGATAARTQTRRRVPMLMLVALIVIPLLGLAALYIGLDRPLATAAAMLMETH
ncbi:type VI secretion system protein ImpK [Pseudomonas antarctica]|uniref:Type VI secretion system protein ImpK n=1 Tax=Pseudomonas antarctica TaxID=219572 RepID=A0A1H0ALL9_9PSED|nr:DotU family type IV/VI secretion system protein [Pseudomonas antarctica]KAF2407377.1 hypothetical protein PSAN_43060 [Pseudomonas antarctica]SDN34251.1 type VI secretion system protein ImpK [Pseudomonas antarctica]